MSLHKKMIAVVLVILVYSCSLAEGAPRNYPSATACQDNGSCIPKRATFGYTPTTWRRWPTDQAGPAPKAEKAVTPTPAQKPKSNGDSEAPILAPEEPAMIPSENEPPFDSMEKGLEKPHQDSGSPDLAPPFEDNPPEPPKETLGPSEEKSPNGSAKPPTELKAPFEDEPLPTMPDDDPFKDDPSGKNGSRGEKSQEGKMADHWQAAPLRWLNVERDSRDSDEPRRLQVVRTEVDGHPVGTAFTGNPLRPGNSKGREGESVVPTASWSAEVNSSGGGGSTFRRNPLRTN